MNRSNEWRSSVVAALVAACRSGSAEAWDTAWKSITIRAGKPSDPGFSMSDLQYHAARLTDRADALETLANEKIATVLWMQGKATRLASQPKRMAEKAERLAAKVRQIGGTVSRTEFAALAVEASNAKYDAEKAVTETATDIAALTAKVVGLSAKVAAMHAEIDAMTQVASEIGDLIAARTTVKVEAIKVAAPVVVA
jgi:hypothetical protein